MHKRALLLSLAVTMSLGVFGQVPDSTSAAQTTGKKSKAAAKTTTDAGKNSADTATRNRVGDASTSMLDPTDEKFLMEAARGGMMEVQLGQIAQQKASSQAVKDYGKRMETDHTQSNKELADIAKARNVSLPTDLGAEKKNVDKLSSRSGASFDKDYMKFSVSDHKKDIKEFEHQQKDGLDSDLKAFAAKTLPTLREHLRLAEETEKGLGKHGSTATTTASDAADATTTKTKKK